MLWIIWTCSWWLVCGITAYLDEVRYTMRNDRPSDEARGFEQLIAVIVWIYGMWKFN